MGTVSRRTVGRPDGGEPTARSVDGAPDWGEVLRRKRELLARLTGTAALLADTIDQLSTEVDQAVIDTGRLGDETERLLVELSIEPGSHPTEIAA